MTCRNCGHRWKIAAAPLPGSFDGALGDLLAVLRELDASLLELRMASAGGGVIKLSARGLTITHQAATDVALFAGGTRALQVCLDALARDAEATP